MEGEEDEDEDEDEEERDESDESDEEAGPAGGGGGAGAPPMAGALPVKAAARPSRRIMVPEESADSAHVLWKGWMRAAGTEASGQTDKVAYYCEWVMPLP